MYALRQWSVAQCASTEGIRMCVEMIQAIQAIKGVHGIHIMAYRQEERVSDIVKDSGALEGRVPCHPGIAQRLIH